MEHDLPRGFAAEFRQAGDLSVKSVNVCREKNGLAKSLDGTVPRGQQVDLRSCSVGAALH